MEFLLEGGGKVCGHLSNSIAGGIPHPWVLGRKKEQMIKKWEMMQLNIDQLTIKTVK